MRFWKAGHQARRFRKFIERFVEAGLAAQDGSENKMEQSLIGQGRGSILTELGAELVLSGVVLFLIDESRDLSRRTGADTGVGG